jgi:hypothetical protein
MPPVEGGSRRVFQISTQTFLRLLTVIQLPLILVLRLRDFWIAIYEERVFFDFTWPASLLVLPHIIFISLNMTKKRAGDIGVNRKG